MTFTIDKNVTEYPLPYRYELFGRSSFQMSLMNREDSIENMEWLDYNIPDFSNPNTFGNNNIPRYDDKYFPIVYAVTAHLPKPYHDSEYIYVNNNITIESDENQYKKRIKLKNGKKKTKYKPLLILGTSIRGISGINTTNGFC